MNQEKKIEVKCSFTEMCTDYPDKCPACEKNLNVKRSMYRKINSL